MLTHGQATLLENRLERVSCVDPKLADGLFTYVLKGEPSQDEPHYEQHLNNVSTAASH